MPRVAQQDYLVIHDPEMELETNTIPDSVKTKLKEAYAAGTIHEVVLKDGGGYTVRKIGTGVEEEKKLKEAYAAGTIYEVVLKDGGGYTVRKIGTGVEEENEPLASVTYAWEDKVRFASV